MGWARNLTVAFIASVVVWNSCTTDDPEEGQNNTRETIKRGAKNLGSGIAGGVEGIDEFLDEEFPEGWSGTKSEAQRLLNNIINKNNDDECDFVLNPAACENDTESLDNH